MYVISKALQTDKQQLDTRVTVVHCGRSTTLVSLSAADTNTPWFYLKRIRILYVWTLNQTHFYKGIQDGSEKRTTSTICGQDCTCWNRMNGGD
jgi:hypothetical protein